MSVEVRDVRPEELDEAAAVMVFAYEEYQKDLRPAMWEAYVRDIADVHGRLAQSRLIVAVADGHIVGAVTYYPPKPEGTGEGWPSGWAGVRLLAVAPTARERGYGRLLMDECLRRARADGAIALGLHTTSVMAVARAMYERMGFDRAPDYDFHPMPGLVVMAYRLNLESS